MVVKDKVLVSVGDIESAWERWETPLYLWRGMYESVTMVNSSATVFSKQDAWGDERVSALRQDEEDSQRISRRVIPIQKSDQWPGSPLQSFESLTTTLSCETPPCSISMIDPPIFFRLRLKRDLNSSLKRLMLRKRICFKTKNKHKVRRTWKTWIESWSCKKKGHLSFECRAKGNKKKAMMIRTKGVLVTTLALFANISR